MVEIIFLNGKNKPLPTHRKPNKFNVPRRLSKKARENKISEKYDIITFRFISEKWNSQREDEPTKS